MKTYEERMACVQQKLQRKNKQRKALMATAGTLCICLVLGIVIPYFKDKNDISMYADSEYFKVIEAINRYLPRKTGNNWLENMLHGMEMGGMVGNVDADVPEAVAPNATPDLEHGVSSGVNAGTNLDSSVEITDHQVAGVLEADIIKRSQTHIFYLKSNTLEVYPIAGLETELLGTWSMERKEDVIYNDVEMFLSADATRVNLIISGYGDVFQKDKRSAFIQLISLDVTDPANVTEANSLYVTGSMLSARMVGDQILLMAQYNMAPKVDFEDEFTFLPQIGTPKDMQSINPDNIQIPETLSDDRYTLVVMLDSKEMTLIDSGAFMSYSTTLYVSKERIYAYRSISSVYEIISEDLKRSRNMSQITCMSYDADGLALQGSFALEGYVKDQYSMDEYDGIFRVVTNTLQITQGYIGGRPTEGTKDAQGNTAPPQSPQPTRVNETIRSANLTCFKVGTWEQVAQVAQFAPEGETVESVRFDGDYAYVCTAVVVQLTDPVYFFDMSDINNIKVKDTGTIDGYSSSLVQLKEGYLMGIGYNDKLNLKVEIYEEAENGVVSVCEFIHVNRFAIDYKAYYIDRENNLFGIPTGSGYILLQFDGYQLNLLAQAETTHGYSISELGDFRGVVIDKCLYVFGPDYFNVQRIG